MTTTTQSRPNYERAEIILALFPHSDLRTAKTRPALIVQADDLQVMTDNLATIAEVAIDRVIGTLPMKDVDKALRHTLGL